MVDLCTATYWPEGVPDANTFFPSGALYTWRESQGQQTTHQQQRTPRSQEKTPQYFFLFFLGAVLLSPASTSLRVA